MFLPYTTVVDWCRRNRHWWKRVCAPAPIGILSPEWEMGNAMTELFQWFEANANVLALLATIGVAVFLVCCLGCTSSSDRDKDDLFKHHEV